MALRSSEEQLSSAWRALGGKAEGAGWNAIEILRAGQCMVMAGRRGAGNEECLLVGLVGAPRIKDQLMPRSSGFSMFHTELQIDSGRTWYALIRQKGGQLPLFTLMAADLVDLLERVAEAPGSTTLATMLTRVRAWQDFMRREHSGVLTAEEEVGLLGEIVVLENLIADGIAPGNALDAWMGPLDGLHDFEVGTGAIEVKTTTISAGFIARIGSLDQLDDSLHHPLYVACVRVAQGETGRTLPEFLDSVSMLIGDEAAASVLSARLVAAGYLEGMREQYSRRFSVKELSYRQIMADSHRLTKGNVPSCIREASYTLDLESVPVAAGNFHEIAEHLGIQAKWN